jgi:hypothetical protein
MANWIEVWDEIDSETRALRNEANRDARDDPEFRCHDDECDCEECQHVARYVAWDNPRRDWRNEA